MFGIINLTCSETTKLMFTVLSYILGQKRFQTNRPVQKSAVPDQGAPRGSDLPLNVFFAIVFGSV